MAMNRSGNREFPDDPEMIRQFQMDELDRDPAGAVQDEQRGPMGRMSEPSYAWQQAPSSMNTEQRAEFDEGRDTFYRAGRGADWERHHRPVGPNGETQGLLDLRSQFGGNKTAMSPGAAPAPGGASPMAGGASARYGTGDIPGAENVAGGEFAGGGFNTAGWGTQERGTNSIKNTFGKIASRYDPQQQGAVRQILADPEFAQFFPEATLVEHPKGDLIDFGDGNPVDVLRNAVEGGSGDAWQFLAGGGQGAPMDAGMGGGMDLGSMLGGETADDNQTIEQIRLALEQLARGGETDPYRAAVLDALDPKTQV